MWLGLWSLQKLRVPSASHRIRPLQHIDATGKLGGPM